jgi:hypothetical protein
MSISGSPLSPLVLLRWNEYQSDAAVAGVVGAYVAAAVARKTQGDEKDGNDE